MMYSCRVCDEAFALYGAETMIYADLIRWHVKWYTSYGEGGITAPVDFEVGEPCLCMACVAYKAATGRIL